MDRDLTPEIDPCLETDLCLGMDPCLETDLCLEVLEVMRIPELLLREVLTT